MTARVDGYSKWRHKGAVEAAAREAGIKGAALSAIVDLCQLLERERPFVRVSKERLAERTGYCVKTIKAALGELKRAGLVHPVAYAQGGRGRAPVYLLRTGKGGENVTPLGVENEYKGGKFLPEKGGKNFQKRGEKTSPPFNNPSDNPSDKEKGGAFRAGRADRTLDAGASPGPRSASPEKPVQWVKPSEVRSLLIEWGYKGSEIDGFTTREVENLLKAQGLRLRRELP